MGRFDCATLLSSVTLFDVSTRSVMWLSAIVHAPFFSRPEGPLDGRHENSRGGVSPERVLAAEMIQLADSTIARRRSGSLYRCATLFSSKNDTS